MYGGTFGYFYDTLNNFLPYSSFKCTSSLLWLSAVVDETKHNLYKLKMWFT